MDRRPAQRSAAGKSVRNLTHGRIGRSQVIDRVDKPYPDAAVSPTVSGASGVVLADSAETTVPTILGPSRSYFLW